MGIPMELFMVIIIAVGFPIVWVVLRRLDYSRIFYYLAARECVLTKIAWVPRFFRHSWDMYRLTYRDEKGDIHEALCKTGLWVEVHFTQDVVIESPDQNEVMPVGAGIGS